MASALSADGGCLCSITVEPVIPKDASLQYSNIKMVQVVPRLSLSTERVKPASILNTHMHKTKQGEKQQQIKHDTVNSTEYS